MEECCVVCAEPLEWVAYGPCGHKDVCSTCVARLRFVLDDKKCCICKQECPSVFVTKALDDYTKLVSGFEVLSNSSIAGNGGTKFWYDNDTEAYFDDVDHFKMIKVMCRLYCSICEQAESYASRDTVKKGYIFRNLEHLRHHFYHVHRVKMCDLCLEGRKVFLGDQKLYTKAQLNHHLSGGDPKIDGREGERGGFTGHPMCDFCRKRFYGENELFQHMSREHFTCHICKRLQPERFDYYRNYDDLEAHFSHEHYLCEDKECLAKKFVVFPSDTELKRHNALQHGGNMSRAQRNAALQIPVSFQYQRPRQEYRLPRGTGRNRGAFTDNGSSETTHASSNTVVLETRNQEIAVVPVEGRNTTSIDSTSSRIEPVGPTSVLLDDESKRHSTSTEPSRYLAAVSGSVPSTLEKSAFPPLPGSSSKSLNGQGFTSIAAHSGAGQSGWRALNLQDHRNFRANSYWSHALEATPMRQNKQNTGGVSESSVASKMDSFPVITFSQSQPSSSQGSFGTNNSLPNVFEAMPAQPNKLTTLGESEKLAKNTKDSSQPVRSSMGSDNNDRSSNMLNMDEIRVANKVLVDHIRSGLNGSKELFIVFKNISSQFKKGEIDAKEYCKYIVSFGLSHLVCELAMLCPDPVKQKDLLDAYTQTQIRGKLEAQSDFSSAREINAGDIGDARKRGMNTHEVEISPELPMAGLKQNQDRGKRIPDEMEVLTKNDYRDLKGKVKLPMCGGGSSVSEAAAGENKSVLVLVKSRRPTLLDPYTSESSPTVENKVGASQCVACGTDGHCEKSSNMENTGGNERRRKKTPKFHRLRLGDGSISALTEPRENPWNIDHREETANTVPSGGRSSGYGAWKNGGGQLLSKMLKDP